MVSTSCIIVLLGLLISIGPQSASQRTIAILILLLGLVGAVRSLVAYEVRMSEEEVVLKGLYTTNRVPYKSICKATRTVGAVGFLKYQRAYLELIRQDRAPIDFKALNESVGKSGLIDQAVAAINYQIDKR